MGGGIVFLLQMVIYHISFPVLFLLSRILNRSFLLYYPNQTLPQLIAPLNNCDLRTFTISPLEVQHIHQIRPHLLPPIVRSWMPPPEVETFITRQVSLDSIAVLSEDSNKIPCFIDGHLGQGMGIIFEGKRMFIWEEVGRWPTRLDQVATLTYSWDSNQFLVLFIPAKYFVDDGDLPRSATNLITDNYAHVSGPFGFLPQFLIQNLTP